MVGEILKKAREAKCLTQRDISQNTNLLLQVVADLENDDFRRIPAAIYGRGFIKLYAEYVGLPPDQVDKLLQTFKQQYDGAHAPPVRTKQVPQQQPKTLRRPGSAPAEGTEDNAGSASPALPPAVQQPARRPIFQRRTSAAVPPAADEPSQPIPAVPAVSMPEPEPADAPVAVPPKGGVPERLSPSAETAVPFSETAATPIPSIPLPADEPAAPSKLSRTQGSEPHGKPAGEQAAGVQAAKAETAVPEVPPRGGVSMDEDGLLPLFAALHKRDDAAADRPESAPEPSGKQTAKPAQASVEPAVSTAPVQVNGDFSGLVVPSESQAETDDGDDLFSMAKRLTQLRGGNAASTDSAVPGETGQPAATPPAKPLVTRTPGRIVLPGNRGGESGESAAVPATVPETPKKPPFSLTMKRAVRISLDRITEAAHRSMDASSKAIQPAKTFFAGREKAVFLWGAGAAVLLLLFFGIHYLFQVTEQRMIEQETTTSLPPPELYLD